MGLWPRPLLQAGVDWPTIGPMDLPEPIALANLPTPVQRLTRLSHVHAADMWVKRDDLTGSHLSGNKVRKLEYLLAHALRQGATHVITCGGIQSNHCRATALAAAPLGLVPMVLLRTERGLPEDLPTPPTGNVLLDLLAGAEIHLCDPDGYAQRDARMAELAERVRQRGGRPVVVVEGGSDALGCLGYVHAALEIAQQWEGPQPTSVVVATGSGGTAAGLALGLRALGWNTRVVGMAVCDDEATFTAIVERICDEAADRYGLVRPESDRVRFLDGYQGRGYALSSDLELALIRDTARQDGLVLDPVYTAKALRGLLDVLHKDRECVGDRPLFIHTGGIFGLLGAVEPLSTCL